MRPRAAGNKSTAAIALLQNENTEALMEFINDLRTALKNHALPTGALNELLYETA